MALSELRKVAQTLGMPSFAGGQVVKWLYRRRVTNIGEMTDISKPNHERLAEEYKIDCMAHVDVQYSKDETIKYLLPTASGRFVETVFVPDDDHTALCVFCQVGCKMNCLSCQTGKQGSEDNLTYADILNQVYSLPECDRLTNIVFMGQGEPMDNLDNVLRITQVMTADYGYAWSPKHTAVNSVGVKGKLEHFLGESDCHVAISLHSVLPEQRSVLMPAEKGMPIEQIVDLLRNYDFVHQRRLSFEYIVFGGLNGTPMHARRIIDLLRGLNCRVNLIRFHQIPNVPLRGADEQKMENFCSHLTSHDVFITIQASRRQDIFATCGLLSVTKKAGA